MKEKELLDLIKRGEYRCVYNPKRKRKLNKRGDLCQWSSQTNCWVWKPSKSWRKNLSESKIRRFQEW